jgi:hypothetical protein
LKVTGVKRGPLVIELLEVADARNQRSLCLKRSIPGIQPFAP